MDVLHSPWLALGLLSPLIGAAAVALARDPDHARRRSLVASGLALAFAVGGWLDFVATTRGATPDRADPLAERVLPGLLALDPLSAPLLPLAALICVLTNLATLRTKVREFSFGRSLVSEALLLATLGCKQPWALVLLLAAGTVPPLLELRRSRKPTGVYLAHMLVFVGLMAAGQLLLDRADPSAPPPLPGVLLLTAAMLLRSGVVPVHCWMTDLFEHVTFGTALLFVTPMVGAYGVARLVLPVAPDGVLAVIALASLVTAIYAAGMALVQWEARRFFCYLFLSHSSLVLVGIETATPIGLTAALCLWLSVALSLTGFGLTMRCVESRTGRVSLATFHGLQQHAPMLAALFLLTGLASIGFPGTIGFIGLELLVEGAVRASPLVGVAVVLVAALNGLAVMHAYFRIFSGRSRVTTIDLRVRRAERVSVLVLTALILGGGLFPQPGVTILHRAAVGLARSRASSTEPPAHAAGPTAEARRPG